MRLSQPNTCLPLFLTFALFAGQALAADFTVRVVGVSDGDTITVLHNGRAMCSEIISFVKTLGPTGGPFNLATLRGANLEGFVNRACERTITSRGLGAG